MHAHQNENILCLQFVFNTNKWLELGKKHRALFASTRPQGNPQNGFCSIFGHAEILIFYPSEPHASFRQDTAILAFLNSTRFKRCALQQWKCKWSILLFIPNECGKQQTWQ